LISKRENYIHFIYNKIFKSINKYKLKFVYQLQNESSV
jgi:hypothetical protein